MSKTFKNFKACVGTEIPEIEREAITSVIDNHPLFLHRQKQHGDALEHAVHMYETFGVAIFLELFEVSKQYQELCDAVDQARFEINEMMKRATVFFQEHARIERGSSYEDVL